ncbi:MAG: DUF1343 domain-containing protein [Chloroflexi bacterium]|nr:DUF1343 domain-containing protein [Chloroflexota bacterium]
MKPTRREALALLCAATATACTTPAPSQRPPPTGTPPGAPATSTALPSAPTQLTSGPPTASAPTAVPPTAMPTPTPAVLTGVDVLLRDGLETLSAKRVGLITNATGRTSDGRSTIDALHADSRWSLAALFSPEHGIRGEAQAGQSIDSRTDPATGLPIHSLYGTTTRPTAQMLQGLDALVYDVQDVGARTYTYISTLLEVMRAASQHSLPVVVLDRPNPIGGDHVDGNVLDTRFASFVGPAPIAMRYGMTLGELAQRFNADVGADLHVLRLVGWQRSMWFDQTDLEWVNPSPNIRSLSAAALYPGTVLFEGTNLSEGRGTPIPFEWFGAPWLNVDSLVALDLPGVRLTPVDHTPDAGADKYPGEVCHGLSIEAHDRQALQPMDLAVRLLAGLRGTRLQFNAATFDALAGTDHLRQALQTNARVDDIIAAWQPHLANFQARRRQYLLY